MIFSSDSDLWVRPPNVPLLANGEAHIWCASLDQFAALQAQFWSVLSPEEQARAKQFRFEEGRRRFVVGRGVLRVLLGGYQHCAPEQLQFDYGTNGKPFLAHPQQEIQFNASHSRELALFAFTTYHAVGVDIEYMRAFPDAASIIDHFFSAQEQSHFRSLPPDKQTEAFFAGWTRKEAYLKACGDGLSYPLSQFEVSMAPDEPARIISIGGEKQKVKEWFLQDIASPLADYKAALAIHGKQQWTIKQWLWTQR